MEVEERSQDWTRFAARFHEIRRVVSNLGVFDTAARAAREGRNPATGATIKIAASKAVRFRVSKPLKDAVNK